MIIFENVEVMNMKNALRGMRNPQNSWSKADSYIDDVGCFNFVVGENDLQLAQKLVKAGTSHRKFMRQILVSVDFSNKKVCEKHYKMLCASIEKAHKHPNTHAEREKFRKIIFGGGKE